MSNGPINLPHMNLHRQQEQDPATFQGLPPMQQQPATQNNYYHGQSFAREGKISSHSSHPLPRLLCSTERGVVGCTYFGTILTLCVKDNRCTRRRQSHQR